MTKHLTNLLSSVTTTFLQKIAVEWGRLSRFPAKMTLVHIGALPSIGKMLFSKSSSRLVQESKDFYYFSSVPVESTLAVGQAEGESHKIHKFNLSSDLYSILLKWTLCWKKLKSTLLTNNWPIIFYTSFVGKKFCLCLIGKGKKCSKSNRQQETRKHFLSSSSEKWDSKLEAR